MKGRNSVIGILLLFVGALMVYAGVKNRNPIDMIKLVLTGGDPANAGPVGKSNVIGKWVDPNEGTTGGLSKTVSI